MRYLFFLLLLIYSCKQKKERIEKVETNTNQRKKLDTPVFTTDAPISIDYKFEKHKFYLNKNFKKCNNNIDWQWGYLGDKDGKIDSSSYDSFFGYDDSLFLKEGTVLNTIFIETFKNKIFQFKYGIIFNLNDSTSATKKDFLKMLSKSISALKKSEISNALVYGGEYKADKANYYEFFKLRIDTSLSMNHFDYEIRLKELK